MNAKRRQSAKHPGPDASREMSPFLLRFAVGENCKASVRDSTWDAYDYSAELCVYVAQDAEWATGSQITRQEVDSTSDESTDR